MATTPKSKLTTRAAKPTAARVARRAQPASEPEDLEDVEADEATPDEAELDEADVELEPTLKASASKTSSDDNKKSRASAAASADHLASYFRDLSEHDLLDPDQEREIAQGIEEQELLTWERLLSNAPTTEHVLVLLEGRMDNSLKEFRNVRRAAASARRARTKTSRDRLRAAGRKAAEQLRVLDLDRKHVEAVMAELVSLIKAPTSHHGPKLAFSPTSKAYQSYLHEARLAFRAAQQLRNEFVRANLRLVVTMARRYDRGGMPLSDLIQEGNLGLMHAVSRFDYRRGLRFSTYACWWIRHAIGRALADKSRAVRIPVHMLEAQQQLHKVEQKLIADLGRQPTPAELAEAAKLPMSKLNQMHRYLMGQPMSLDRPLREDDDRAFGEILADPKTDDYSPEDEMTNRALAERVEHLLDRLSPIEADVLRQRFGLEDDEERTFREIGDQYQLSRERIRQIQNAALGKLRRALDRTL